METNKETITVNIPQKNAYSYDIFIGENLTENVGTLIRQHSNANKFLIVTNETVENLYKDILNIDNSTLLVLKDGEEYKNFDTYKLILDAATQNRMERKDCIIAFGGGVVGDMAGFAASTYMRGCDFIQIPTTLLAQVDSSVGGKVAINHENGKNLIGSFYQPKLVLADISVLKTLDLRQFKTGLAEILKYAFIEKSCNSLQEYNLFDYLKQNKKDIFALNPTAIAEVIKICCSLKACVVNQDETEKGIRTILNLGHTFAHAIENITNYKVYTHGEAVAMGMKMAFKLSLNLNLTNKSYYNDAIDLINDFEIAPDIPDIDKEKFYDEMFLDKKAENGKIRFVLPDDFGSVKIVSDISKELVFDSLYT